MTVLVASTTAQLLKFVSTAANGDVIQLKPGTYGAVQISGALKSGNVTITSADPLHPAVLTDLSVRNSSGLTFSKLEMFGTRDAPFQIASSSRIALDKLDVHGTLNGSSSDDWRGMIVRDSTNVTVSNSHFHELTDALSHYNTKFLTVTGNTFDVLRDNGVVGGGSSNITVSNNTFTNFDHTGDIHPDAIQFWTTNTTVAASDIAIVGNVFERGSGSAIQGIWVQDDVGTLPYQNLTIANNTIVGSTYHGIFVTHADNAILSGNVVIAADDQDAWIGVKNVAAATITDNIATTFNFIGSAVTSSGNVKAGAVGTAQAAKLKLPALSANLQDARLMLQARVQTSDTMKAALPSGVQLFGFIDAPSASGQVFNFVEARIAGTAGSDRLAANAVGASHLYGYDGADALTGSRNGIVTTLEGGKGDDVYTIYQAQDIVVEQANEGADTIYTSVNYTLPANVELLRAAVGGLTLTGNNDANTLVAHADGSSLYGGGGDDVLQGAAGNDRLFGGDGNDRITGAGGDDFIDGGTGNDALYGGEGNDTILGGEGADTIEGGLGLDTLTGGKGADMFTFRNGDFNAASLAASKDVITDFNAADGDRIGLNLIDAKTATAADDAFSFIGSQAFHGIAGELRFAMDGDGITVYGDTNGDRIADLAIHLTGVTTIAASSFFL